MELGLYACVSGDPKNAHLGRLEGASDNLRLLKADVLDHGALAAAVAGCRGVFHVACPVPTDKVVDPEASIYQLVLPGAFPMNFTAGDIYVTEFTFTVQSEVLGPAVKGTLNILQACSANNVQKVVVVSSTAAIHFNPKWPRDRPKDEECWSDIDFCKENEVSGVLLMFGKSYNPRDVLGFPPRKRRIHLYSHRIKIFIIIDILSSLIFCSNSDHSLYSKIYFKHIHKDKSCSK